jgi:hypothetical protein
MYFRLEARTTINISKVHTMCGLGTVLKTMVLVNARRRNIFLRNTIICGVS